MKQNRYPGVRPFEAADRGLYFGRERDCADLAGLIGLEKLVVLFGKSGYGKSSLINAGVIPLLESKGSLAFPIRIGTYSEGQESILDIFLKRLESDNRIPVNPEMEFLDARCPGKTLWYYAKRRQEKNSRWVFFFDQFEEYFLHPAVIRRNFEEQLAELMYTNVPQVVLDNSHDCKDSELALLLQPLDIHVVFSIRADHLSELDGMKERLPAILLKRFELAALKRDQAYDGIVKPARLVGDFFSTPFEYRDDALEKILDGLSEPTGGIEAFQLQILCDYIDNKVIKGEVPDRDNNGLPDVEIKDLPPLDQVLGEYYKRKMGTLPPEKKAAANYIIEEKLIFENEQTGEARRVSIDKDQLIQDAAPHGADELLLGQLENTFLVRRLPNTTGGFNYEISHDTLVAPVRKAKLERKKAEKQKAEIKNRTIRRIGLITFGLLALITILYSYEKNRFNEEKESINAVVKLTQSKNELALAMADKDPTMALQLEKNALETLESANKSLELLKKKSFPLISFTSYKATSIDNLVSEYSGIKAKITRQSDSLSGKDYALYKIVKPINPEDTIFDIRFVNAIFPDSNVDSIFKVWHADKKIIDTIKNHDQLTEVIFPTESNEAMALYKDQNVHYWGTKRYYKELIKGKNDRITSIAAIRYAVIGYKMLSALNNKRIVEWNLNGTIRSSNNRPVIYTKDVQFDDSVVSIAISPNRAKIFTASDKGMGNIWPADTSKVLLHPAAKRAFNLFQDTIICSAFSNDGSMIVTGSKDNTVKIWTADSGNLIKVLNGHKGPVTAVAFSANNSFVFTGSIDGTFRKWRLPEADSLSKMYSSQSKMNSVQWNMTKSFDSLFFMKIIESNTSTKK